MLAPASRLCNRYGIVVATALMQCSNNSLAWHDVHQREIQVQNNRPRPSYQRQKQRFVRGLTCVTEAGLEPKGVTTGAAVSGGDDRIV